MNCSKPIFFLCLVISSASSYASVFRDIPDIIGEVMDIANYPVDMLLELKEAPIVRHIFSEHGKFGDYCRFTKFAVTVALARVAYSNKKVQEITTQTISHIKQLYAYIVRMYAQQKEVASETQQDEIN